MKFTKISLLALSFAAALDYVVAMEQTETPAATEAVVPAAPVETQVPAEEVKPSVPVEVPAPAEEAKPVETAKPEVDDQDTEDFFKDLMVGDDEEAK